MDFDFETLLVGLTLVTGIIWFIDAKFFAPKRALASRTVNATRTLAEGDREEIAREPVIVEYARSFFPVILAVLFLRSFLVEPFRIPSGSMLPTLFVGDFILVNKFTYGLRLPVLHTKILPLNAPERGDVMVFRFPREPSVDYIKRVVGLPGDEIKYVDKQLFINGEPVPLQPQGIYTEVSSGMAAPSADLFIEQLGGVSHDVLHQARPGRNGNWTVPEGHYFVMGDNRDNSNDSREWHWVPEQNIVGKAFFVWLSWDKVGKSIRWNRIGDSID